MQNGSLTLNGSGLGTVVAPCAAEAFDLISGAHAFTVQYVVRSIEAQQTNQVGAGIGAATLAEEISATDFIFRVESARSNPFQQGEAIALIVGTAADVIGIRPRRTL